MRTKKRNNELISSADRAVRATPELWATNNLIDGIQDGYNAKISAFGVSIAMIDLLPTIAAFCKDLPSNDTTSTQSTKVKTYVVASAIAFMLSEKDGDDYSSFSIGNSADRAQELFTYAVGNPNNVETLTEDVVACCIALKQVVRTYKIAKNG